MPRSAALRCALVLAALAGCAPDPGARVVVEFWAMGREGAVVEALMPEFERRHPGIRVKVQQVPWRAAHEKLLTAYAGGAMPDMFQVGNTWIPELVVLGAVERLDTRIASSSAIVAADYFPGILETNVIHGATYGVPWYVDTRLLFYRRDIVEQAGFPEPPRTWKQWVETMVRIKQHVGPDNYAVLLPMNEWEPLVILAMQLGAELLRDNHRYGNFRSPQFRDAFGFYLDIFRRGLAPAVGETQLANVYQDFANGHFSFYVTGPWNIGEFERRLPSSLSGKWSTAPMPGPSDDGPGLSLAGGASLAISPASPHQDAAWRLIEFLSEPAQQVALYRLTGDLPPRGAAWQEAMLAEHPQARAFWTQLQHVTTTPKIPEWERIASYVARYAELAIRNQMTADEALAALDRDVDDVLEKRRWLLQRRPSGNNRIEAVRHPSPSER